MDDTRTGGSSWKKAACDEDDSPHEGDSFIQVQTKSSTMSNICLKCIKIFLLVFNIIFLICGAAILGIGIWVHLDKNIISYIDILHTTPSGPFLDVISYVLMAVGGFIFLFSFLGCCGAVAESTCFLCLYSFLLVLVFLGEIVCAVLIAIFRKKIDHVIGESMRKQVKYDFKHKSQMSPNETDAFTLAFSAMQVEFQCCGSYGPQDYKNSNFVNHTKLPKGSTSGQQAAAFVPLTCCVLTNEDPLNPQPKNTKQCQIDSLLYPDNIMGSQVVHTNGCHDEVMQWLRDNMFIMIGIIGAIVFLQFITLVLSCVLMKLIRVEQAKNPWYMDEYD